MGNYLNWLPQVATELHDQSIALDGYSTTIQKIHIPALLPIVILYYLLSTFFKKNEMTPKAHFFKAQNEDSLSYFSLKIHCLGGSFWIS